MEFTVGNIYEGKVTGITGFGAFVQLAPGKSGMVHISEIANTYVDDIKKHIKEGDTVKVKLIAIDQNGRINLSIKKALPVPEKPQAAPKPRNASPAKPAGNQAPAGTAAPVMEAATIEKSADSLFEDKLRMFMQRSESKMSDLRMQKDKRSGGRRRR
ncbi:MAG: S1 RNA-binding domain-containing protein [Clostridia bacterium]|nr:S1 RNA-binding domain-containing protein [Clostridia bacterium]MBQ3092491.1 S1 RNA-binding domain-containing protein [Clostridia bacterium]MBQ9926328.1 S1 RNA-binding domain-containing protein [Clostridia bacterium]